MWQQLSFGSVGCSVAHRPRDRRPSPATTLGVFVVRGCTYVPSCNLARMVRAETGRPPRVRSRPPASEHRQQFVDHGYRVCADGHGEESNCREPGGSDRGGHGEVVRHQDPPHPFAIRQLRTDPLSLETQRVGALLHLKVFRPQRLRTEWGLAVLTPSTRFAVLTGHATSLRVLSCRKQLRNLLVRAIFIAVGQEFESP